VALVAGNPSVSFLSDVVGRTLDLFFFFSSTRSPEQNEVRDQTEKTCPFFLLSSEGRDYFKPLPTGRPSFRLDGFFSSLCPLSIEVFDTFFFP